MEISVQGRLPIRAHSTDAGLDLFADKGYIVEGLTELLQKQKEVIESAFLFQQRYREIDPLDLERLRQIDFEAIHVEIETGTRIAIPSGRVGIVHDRSGLGRRRVKLFGRVIDSGYRGPIIVMASNFGKRWEIREGERVAQLVIYPIEEAIPILRALDETERGTKGLGSTGR